MEKSSNYKKSKGALLERVDGKFYVVFDYEVFEVNEVGARIFELCNGRNSIEGITGKISKYFNKNNDEVFEDVLFYIQELTENKLVEIVD